MDEDSSYLMLEVPCDEAVELLTSRFKQAGLRVVRTFDLHTTRQAMVACSCPHHGMPACDCQLVVLLVYSAVQRPVSIVAHGYNQQTWFSMVDTPQQRADPYLEATLRNLAKESLLAAR